MPCPRSLFEDSSFRKHPHDLVLPATRLSVMAVISEPQSHLQTHALLFLPSLPTTGSALRSACSRPNCIPLRSLAVSFFTSFNSFHTTHYLSRCATPRRCSSALALALLCLSAEHRLYLHPFGCLPLPPSVAYGVLPRGIVVGRSPVRSFAADCPLSRHLGFNLMPSTYFFLLSPPSRLGLFHPCAVAYVALGCSSNSIGYFSNTFL